MTERRVGGIGRGTRGRDRGFRGVLELASVGGVVAAS